MRLTTLLILTTMTLGACSNQGLKQVTSSSRGPDEFLVEPKAALTMPNDFSALPAPTPGQGNRTDVDPQAEMVVALGGRPNNASGPIPASDGPLVTAASRFGVTSEVRAALAAEDAAFRRSKSRFSQFKLFPEDVYNDVYRSQSLDARATAQAWRRAGVQTPSFPPAD